MNNRFKLFYVQVAGDEFLNKQLVLSDCNIEERLIPAKILQSIFYFIAECPEDFLLKTQEIPVFKKLDSFKIKWKY